MSNANLAQQAIKRTAAIQKLSPVDTEVIEILPAVIEAIKSVGFDPLQFMQKTITKAAKRLEEAKDADHIR